MHRRAAITAMVAGGGIGAQPVAARLALGVDALHSPAGQVLHVTSRLQLAGIAAEFF